MARAPGRVNLIGEHTDYNSGFVLPMALELECEVDASPRDDGMLAAESVNLGESREWAVAGLPQVQPAGDWGDYIAGVARELVRRGYEIRASTLRVDSRVPVGSGLSSSAALEVATARSLLAGRAIDPLELVRLCRRAENDFVGMPCGIMDQYVAVFGRPRFALLIDCRSLDHELIPLPSNVEVTIVNSMVKHELGQTAYRQRVEECRQACIDLGVESLRDAAGLATINKRARHVITENDRVLRFVAAARRGDLQEMGALFLESHRSLRDDYEVSCAELDFLVDEAMTIPGVYGARMTGGGFGGCTVNLLAPGARGEFERRISESYQRVWNLTAKVI